MSDTILIIRIIIPVLVDKLRPEFCINTTTTIYSLIYDLFSNTYLINISIIKQRHVHVNIVIREVYHISLYYDTRDIITI